MFFGRNFNHSIRNFHNATAAQPQNPTGTAQQPQTTQLNAVVPAFRGAASRVACCQMALPMLPVDMGIDIASVRADIENCKRRYQQDVWNVLCSKALAGGGAATTGGGSWKNPADHRDVESAASATSGAGVAKQAPPSTEAASTVGSGQGKSKEATTEEEHQQQLGLDEEATTDEAVNENNLMNRRLAARRRSASAVRRQPSQRDLWSSGKGNGNSSSFGGGGKDDWRNFNNSTYDLRRAAIRQPESQSHPGQHRRRQPEVVTAQPQIKSERRYNPEFDGGDCDEESSSDDEFTFNSGGRRNGDLADDHCSYRSYDTSDSAGDEFQYGRHFVPIFCGNWAAAGMGRSSRVRTRGRRRGGLIVTYREAMPAPANEQRSAMF